MSNEQEPTRYETMHILLDEAMEKKMLAGFAGFSEPHVAEVDLQSGSRIRVTLEIWPSQDSIEQARRQAEEVRRRDKFRWN